MTDNQPTSPTPATTKPVEAPKVDVNNLETIKGKPMEVEAIHEAQTLMNFPEAISQLTIGKKIHKLEWKDEENFGVLKDGIVMLHKPDGKFYQWIISDGDLAGTDWITI